jgi:hypothetical protein
VRRSKRSLEGEILIDHRASPGLTPQQLEGFGLAVPGGEVYESAVYTCSHCTCAVVINPQRTRERGWCAKCDKYLCDECALQMKLSHECRNAKRRLDVAHDAIERFGGVSPLLLTQR